MPRVTARLVAGSFFNTKKLKKLKKSCTVLDLRAGLDDVELAVFVVYSDWYEALSYWCERPSGTSV